jgi:hypothetical protein
MRDFQKESLASDRAARIREVSKDTVAKRLDARYTRIIYVNGRLLEQCSVNFSHELGRGNFHWMPPVLKVRSTE